MYAHDSSALEEIPIIWNHPCQAVWKPESKWLETILVETTWAQLESCSAMFPMASRNKLSGGVGAGDRSEWGGRTLE